MKSAIFLLFVMYLTGCASLLSGNSHTVLIESPVDNVEIYWNGKFMGETPASIELPASNSVVLQLKKKNYQTRLIKLKTKINAYFWLNLSIPIIGTTGASTDYGGGAIYEYKPDTYMIELKPLRSSKNSQSLWQEKLFPKVMEERLANEMARGQAGEALQTSSYLNKIQFSQTETD